MAKTKKPTKKKKERCIYITSMDEITDDLKKEVKKFCDKASMIFDFESSDIDDFKSFIREINDSEEESLDRYSIDTTYMVKLGKYTVSVTSSESRNDMSLSDPEWAGDVLIEF